VSGVLFTVVVFGTIGVAIGAALRATGADAWLNPEQQPHTMTAAPSVPAASSLPAAPSVPAASSPSASPSASTASPEGRTPGADDVPPGAEVPPGFGLVEVSATPAARVRIDGAFAGAGPIVSHVASPGYHEVRVEQGDREAKHVIEVRAGKVTRLSSAQP
jgi:hypothetical protein